MKQKEFDFQEFVNEAFGQFIMAIGRGDFQGTVRSYLIDLYSKGNQIGYARGVADTKAAMKKRKKK